MDLNNKVPDDGQNKPTKTLDEVSASPKHYDKYK